MKTETEVVLKNEDSPTEMIRLAVSQGADLDKLEKLLGLQERWEQNEAKKAFYQAMASFKANAPKIDKDRKVSYGTTKYNHASLSNITEKVGFELSKWGLSASWETHQNGQIQVTCRITHKQGHSVSTTLSAPSDTSGSKNSIQAIGSTITYLERYTLLALTGLATFEQDDDGASAETECINEKELSQLIDMIADKGADEAKFLEYMKIESLEKMPKDKFQQAMEALKNKKKVAK